MGNLSSLVDDDTLSASHSACNSSIDGIRAVEKDDRILLHADFDEWMKDVYHEFSFPTPCKLVHNTGALPYSLDNCYIMQTAGSRRRLRQWRRETTRYLVGS